MDQMGQRCRAVPSSLIFATGYVGELREEERYGAISEAMKTSVFSNMSWVFDGCGAIIDSPWTKGCRSWKGERKQSRVLTAEEVLALEKWCIKSRSVCRWDFFLFMIYSRARASDCRAVDREVIALFEGSGFLEVRTMDHMNKSNHEISGQALIAVAPSDGLRTRSWLAAFEEIAKAVGLSLDKTRRGPPLPPCS